MASLQQGTGEMRLVPGRWLQWLLCASQARGRPHRRAGGGLRQTTCIRTVHRLEVPREALGNEFSRHHQGSFMPKENKKIAYHDAARKRDRRMNNVISIFKGDSGGVVDTFLATRGVDMLNAAYHQLDLSPKGRDTAALRQA